MWTHNIATVMRWRGHVRRCTIVVDVNVVVDQPQTGGTRYTVRMRPVTVIPQTSQRQYISLYINDGLFPKGNNVLLTEQMKEHNTCLTITIKYSIQAG
jgi:hypothetical protein